MSILATAFMFFLFGIFAGMMIGQRRRVSTKLTPKYESARVAELRRARAMFRAG